MTREAAEKKLRDNYKFIFAKSIEVDNKNFTAYRLNVIEVESNNYDVVVHLSPNISSVTPMPIDNFLAYPKWNKH